MIQKSAPILIILLMMVSCKTSTVHQADPVKESDSPEMENLEAREDSLELAKALKAQSMIAFRLVADIETEPVKGAAEEDAADDPAIWYNAADPMRSLILGTDKKAGIYVYDLNGKIVQFRNVGRINNVDLREGFVHNGREVVLVAGSNRSNNCISLFFWT